jgi:hypothetical protein
MKMPRAASVADECGEGEDQGRLLVTAAEPSQSGSAEDAGAGGGMADEAFRGVGPLHSDDSYVNYWTIVEARGDGRLVPEPEEVALIGRVAHCSQEIEIVLIEKILVFSVCRIPHFLGGGVEPAIIRDRGTQWTAVQGVGTR